MKRKLSWRHRDPGMSSELSENGGPCSRTVSCRAPPHLQQVDRELGILAGPPLHGQGAGHPSRTTSTGSTGAMAGRQVLGGTDLGAGRGLLPDFGAACKSQLVDLPCESASGFVGFPIRLMSGGGSSK